MRPQEMLEDRVAELAAAVGLAGAAQREAEEALRLARRDYAEQTSAEVPRRPLPERRRFSHAVELCTERCVSVRETEVRSLPRWRKLL